MRFLLRKIATAESEYLRSFQSSVKFDVLKDGRLEGHLGRQACLADLNTLHSLPPQPPVVCTYAPSLSQSLTLLVSFASSLFLSLFLCHHHAPTRMKLMSELLTLISIL